MAGNSVTLEFAGDADKLKRAAKDAENATGRVGDAAERAGDGMGQAAQDATRFEKSMGGLGSATTGAMDAIDGLAAGTQALADAQDYERARASRLERATIDVMQATEDMAQATRDANQASIDSEQAALDLTQARLDQATAQKDYNQAVKEHGRNSDEAKQAQIDLAQAGIDVKQAQEDSAQSMRDGAQAAIDAREAQINLSDAQHEAKPPELQEWADKLNIISPLLSSLVGIVGLVTAAQWLWNASILANPLTWILLGIVALIAGIVLLVKNWDTVKKAAGKAWDWMKEKAKQGWDYIKLIPGRIKESFLKLTNYIFQPFKYAFNKISDAWNATIGQLSWTVPGWVPGVGGNSISAPRLPKFHSGGIVPGRPGQEVPIMALAGERVSPSGRSGGTEAASVSVQIDGDVLIEAISKLVRRRGGSTQAVLGGRNA